jgi:hypothetical protein
MARTLRQMIDGKPGLCLGATHPDAGSSYLDRRRLQMTLKDVPEEFFDELAFKVDLRPHPKIQGDWTWNCDHDLRRAKRIAKKLMLFWVPLEAILHETGGYCDCEVIFNSHRAWERAHRRSGRPRA